MSGPYNEAGCCRDTFRSSDRRRIGLFSAFPPLQPTPVSMGSGHVSFGIATVSEVSDEELGPAFGDAVQNDDGDGSGC